MRRNVKRSSEWKLYVIVDLAAIGSRDPVQVAAAAIRGGADAIQLRDKTGPAKTLCDVARRLLEVTRPSGIPLIINDRADVALAAGASGVHLGQDDLPLADARRLLGPERLIGRSTHSLEQALAAEAEGADYIGCGPVFPTPTKPDAGSVGTALVTSVAARVRIPVVCIGGIDTGNVERVVAAGAVCVAVVRAVCRAADPEAATRQLKHRLIQSGRARAVHRL